ncbi:hypothetical protein LI062_16340, partial [Clostridium perfringens]|nr:hypothetical protein [Clostridium perfringens]
LLLSFTIVFTSTFIILEDKKEIGDSNFRRFEIKLKKNHKKVFNILKLIKLDPFKEKKFQFNNNIYSITYKFTIKIL